MIGCPRYPRRYVTEISIFIDSFASEGSIIKRNLGTDGSSVSFNFTNSNAHSLHAPTFNLLKVYLDKSP